MKLEEVALGCILPGFPGHDAPDWILRRAAEGLGGVVLFAWNVRDAEQAARLTASLPGLLVAVDEEGGDVTRLEAEAGSSYPGNLALGSLDDVALTEQVAAELAADLAEAGVTMNLAPVADVNTNPRNPVIGVRSFGADPELVARHVAAFVRGTQDAGVAACAKHFPGHGDTSVDSHLELPTAQGDLEAALLPFRAAVEADVRAIMTGHLVVPELDGRPATLSVRILTGLLREELGFDGMIVTDALEMRAISGRLGMGEAAVGALAAGADALCLGHDSTDADVGEVRDAIVDAVRRGALAEERVTEAAARVEGAAAVSPCSRARARVRTIGADAAGRAVRLHGDVFVDGPPLVVELATEPSIAAGPSGYRFADAARARWPGVGDAAAASPDEVRALLERADRRLPIVVLRDAGRHDWQQAAAREALAVRPDAVLVETGLPGWRPDGGAAWIETLGAGRVNLEAAVTRMGP
jgi:beta-N-acetylhexosaminidase